MEATKHISIIVTQYDGDAFPEADRYDKFVTRAVAFLHPGFAVEVSYGESNRAFVYGVPGREGDDLAEEIESYVKNECWEEFCAGGYKGEG